MPFPLSPFPFIKSLIYLPFFIVAFYQCNSPDSVELNKSGKKNATYQKNSRYYDDLAKLGDTITGYATLSYQNIKEIKLERMYTLYGWNAKENHWDYYLSARSDGHADPKLARSVIITFQTIDQNESAIDLASINAVIAGPDVLASCGRESKANIELCSTNSSVNIGNSNDPAYKNSIHIEASVNGFVLPDVGLQKINFVINYFVKGIRKCNSLEECPDLKAVADSINSINKK